MSVIEMQPGQKPRRSHASDPADGVGGDVARPASESAANRRCRFSEWEIVAIRVEARVETAVGRQDDRADEGSGAVPLSGQGLGHRNLVRIEDEPDVVTNAVATLRKRRPALLSTTTAAATSNATIHRLARSRRAQMDCIH